MKLYRGVTEDGKGAGTYSLGKGLYTSTDKKWLQDNFKFHKIQNVPEELGYPKNPLKLAQASMFPDWLLAESGHKNMRDFNKEYPDPGEFVKSKGYDGVHAGNEVVKYSNAKVTLAANSSVIVKVPLPQPVLQKKPVAPISYILPV